MGYKMNWLKKASYSWSFGPDFYIALEKAIQWSVEEGLKDGTLEEVWEDAFGEKFPKDASGKPMPADVLVQSLMEKAEKVNTVSSLEPPLEVWISDDGIYSVILEGE